MHQWSRRAATLTLTAVWAVTIGSISTGGQSTMSTDPTPVVNAERLHGPASYSARASANVLRLSDSDAGPHATALNGLRLGTSTARVNTDEPPRSTTSAVQVTGPPGAPRAAVTRSAGDNDQESGTITRTSPGADLPFLTLGSSRLSATANWGSTARPFVLGSALVRPGETVLRGDDDTSLMHVWRGSQSRAQTQLVAVSGQSTLGLRTTARTELTAITLFHGSPTELTIRFLTAPTLVAVAAGTERTDVRYVPPVVAVTAAQGRSYRLDTAGDRVEVPLAGPGCCDGEQSVVRISLGAVRQRIGHTSVDATAAAVRLQIMGAEGVGRLLDATIGDLDVSAHVPVGGLGQPGGGCRACAQPTDQCRECAEQPAEPVIGAETPGRPAATPSSSIASPPPTAEPEPAAPQPVAPSPSPDQPRAETALPMTGIDLSLLAAIGLALLTIGWLILRATRRQRH
jgi:LPXTG-motif cell wall-anchored protein